MKGNLYVISVDWVLSFQVVKCSFGVSFAHKKFFIDESMKYSRQFYWMFLTEFCQPSVCHAAFCFSRH